MDAKKIGQRIRALREEAGETKKFLAKAVGISYRAICAYEYGERIPEDSIKMKLAAHFDRTVESIFFTE